MVSDKDRDVTSDVVAFRDFMLFSWPLIETLKGRSPEWFEYDLGDWMQGNWEVLVESIILPGGSGCLEVYAEGADCNGASSRVFLPSAMPTHTINCELGDGEVIHISGERPEKGTSGRFEFDSFAHWKNTRLEISPPFDFVFMTLDDGEYATKVENANFILSMII